MKLFTRTGDDGSTGLFDGRRVGKDHPRVAAYGAVDEANCCLGLVATELRRDKTIGAFSLMAERLAGIQSELFQIGADLATPSDSPRRDALACVTSEHVTLLERWIDEACADAPVLRQFVLPGGCEAAARLHLARVAVRRAEREVVLLGRDQAVGEQVVPYLNRLSDLLFAWSRQANHASGVEDVLWSPPDAP
ncbi:MAG: cob(I)yrinic acid a,c-diamide adenosyltransferase [Phycisphaerae bacterium]